METQLLKANGSERDREVFGRAGEILRKGGLVAFPTETVYGLGADALNGEAVAGIFAAKGRPQDNPLIVHIAALSEIEPLVATFPPAARVLAEAFWPGPLTIILPKSGRIPGATSAGLSTVAVRMPAHPVAKGIIAAAGRPVAAPSANRSGSPSPTTAAHCAADLTGRVDLIVDGGSCPVGLESTVLSLAGEGPRLLRPGAVTVEQLKEVLGTQVLVDPAVTGKLEEGRQAASPGMKYKHYAPKASLSLVHGSREAFRRYVAGQAGPGVWALVFDGEEEGLSVPALSYGGAEDFAAQAHMLFSALRQLDERNAERVFVHAPRPRGVGLAVYNRLLRAAGFSEIYL